MSLGEIRNLVRQHNKLSVIKGVDTKTRATLIKELKGKGYALDHRNKRIVTDRLIDLKKDLSVGKTGEAKLQKRTKRKQLITGGAKPVMTKPKYPPIPKGTKGKKKKPDRSKLISGK